MSIIKNKILVRDVMLALDDFPIVKTDFILKETMDSMNAFSIGMACVIDEYNVLKGVLTDGDLRRIFLNIQQPLESLFLEDTWEFTNEEFLSVSPSETMHYALKIMEEKKIWDLPVIDEFGKLVGLFHLHPAVMKLMEFLN